MAESDPTQKQIAGKYVGSFDYTKRPHYLRRWRFWCFVVAVAGSLAAIVTFRFWGKPEVLSTGPISENHAAFASDCRVCHLGAETDLLKSLLQSNGASPQRTPAQAEAAAKILSRTSLSLMDQACLQCHPTKGLHLPQSAGLALRTVSRELNVVHATSCAVCHREHVGHDRIPEPERQTCATCHNDAAELRATRRSLKLDHEGIAEAGENRDLGDGVVRFLAPARPVGTLASFTNYSEGHPPFGYERSGVRDPGELKFNHARHLRADLMAGQKGRLDCASCHQPGAGGAFYQPVRYAKHCQECHSLQIQPGLPKLLVPHGDPEKVRYFLASLNVSIEQTLRAEGLDDPNKIAARVESEMAALRQRGLNTQADFEARVFLQGDPQDQADDRRMRSGNAKFLTECAKCHTVGLGNVDRAPRVVPPMLAERWVQRGPFTHLPHQHMNCADCHGGAAKSKLTGDILLPPQKLCAECHRPPDTTAFAISSEMNAPTRPQGIVATQRRAGGVKFDCQSCHTFHAPPDATRVTKESTLRPDTAP